LLLDAKTDYEIPSDFFILFRPIGHNNIYTSKKMRKHDCFP